jgi:hypothetical protein
VAAAPVARRAPRQVEPEAAEPAPAPAPAPAAADPAPLPSAASIAESVLLDRPVPSPGIQPGNGAHPSPDTPPR